MNLTRKLIVSAALALPLSILAIDPAAAFEPCVPVAAVAAVAAVPGTDAIPAVMGWQRYSWTGGPVEGDVAPSFPSSDWQANVAGDPHKVGVAGAYYRSHGGSGKGDWFYLEAVVVTPEVPAVPGTPAVEAVAEVVCEEPTPGPEPTNDPEPPVVIVDPKPEPEVDLGEFGGGEPVDQPKVTALPHTGAGEWIVGGVGLALIIAGGVAVRTASRRP